MLSPEARLRRIIILIEHFVRNVAYLRAAFDEAGNRLGPNTEFWQVVRNNNIDIAVLEWCKLFADARGRHSWTKVVHNQEEFLDSVCNDLRLTREEFGRTIESFKAYRDQFVAHLDDENQMQIPHFDIPLAAARVLFERILQVEAPALGMDTRNREGFDETFAHHSRNARQEYARIAF